MRLPIDIENLIREFHDEFEIGRKRYNMNLVFKTAFGQCVRGYEMRRDLYLELSHYTVRQVDFRLLMNHMRHYDTLMKRIVSENLPYHLLWTLVRAGKTTYVPWCYTGC